MQIAISHRPKILFYWLVFLLCLMHSLVSSDSKLLTPSKIYRRFLKSRSLPFEDCGSSFDMLYLNISSCSSIPCEMQLKSKATVKIIFDDYGKNTNFLKHRVSWIFNGIRTDATITPDPCEGTHECLLNGSDGKSYNSTIHINNSLPRIRGTMLWEAVDDHGCNVICFRVPVLIVK